MHDDDADFYTDSIEEPTGGVPDLRVGYVPEPEDDDPEAGHVEPESDDDAGADDDPDAE